MPEMEHGFKRAISEIVGGFIVSISLVSFVNAGLIPSFLLLIFELLNLVGTIIFILALPYWGTSYMLGWLYGYVVMLRSGMVGFLDLVIYIIIPLIVLSLRFLKIAID